MFLLLKKIKNANDLNNEEIVGMFYEKELQKTNRTQFRVEQVTNYMLKGKAMIIPLEI